MKRTTFWKATMVALASGGAFAATPGTLHEKSTGVEFPVRATVAGTEFTCLGTGLREVYMFDVYALAYCLEPAQVNAIDSWVGTAHPGVSGKELTEALRKDPGFYGRLALAPGEHLVLMKAVRDFSRQKMGEAFRDSLKDILPREKVDKLIAAIPADVKDGDAVRFSSDGSRLTIDIAGKQATIDDQEIATRVWDVWLSGKSVTPSLRKSLAERAASRVQS